MTSPRPLLLCTDMDRTVIPNGPQPEHPGARRSLRAFCADGEVVLVYVTGRHRQLVEAALAEFDLPQPDFVISDVGTRMYAVSGERWDELSLWQDEIAADWKGRSHDDLQQLLAGIADLQLQEASKQSRYKLSYYVPLHCDHNAMIREAQQCLLRADVAAALLWSIDEEAGIGLLDVLPQRATKLHAVMSLQGYLGFADEDVLFAGDSGNDMPVLVSKVRSVLVNNASAEIKQTAVQAAQANGNAAALYLAEEACPLAMNGNYSAGVLQGVWHFAPHFRELLSAVVSAPVVTTPVVTTPAVTAPDVLAGRRSGRGRPHG